MTLTIDELVKVFHDAYGAQPYSGVGHFDLGSRAGIRAIVTALRDEVVEDQGCAYCRATTAMYNEILGDAGNEKAVGESTQQCQTSTPLPAAPAVCVWTWMGEHYSPACIPKEKASWMHAKCPLCLKPTIFKENER